MKKSFKKDKKLKKEKKQALKATWDDSSDEEVANLCFVALEETSNDEVSLDFESNDEMPLACEKLMNKYEIFI